MKEIEIAAQSRGRGGDHQIMSVTVEILYFFLCFWQGKTYKGIRSLR